MQRWIRRLGIDKIRYSLALRIVQNHRKRNWIELKSKFIFTIKEVCCQHNIHQEVKLKCHPLCRFVIVPESVFGNLIQMTRIFFFVSISRYQNIQRWAKNAQMASKAQVLCDYNNSGLNVHVEWLNTIELFLPIVKGMSWPGKLKRYTFLEIRGHFDEVISRNLSSSVEKPLG